MTHIEAIQQWLTKNQLDVAYVSAFPDIKYLTGFGSDPIERVLALFIFPEHEPFIFAPALEVEAVKETGWRFPVYGYLDHEDAFALITEYLNQCTTHPVKWAVQKDNLTLTRFATLKEHFPTMEVAADLTPVIEHERLYKTPEEIAKLEVAGKWADKAFEIGFAALANSRTEQDVAAEIEYELKKQGIMQMSFDTIVQSGANAADPHGAPKKDLIQPNSLCLFDLGVVSDGYISDASRTVAYGPVNDHLKEIYEVCLEAQLTAQDAAKPGMTAAELDHIGRQVIEKAGYGEYFIHRLGHGMGQSEHEFPSIMEGNDMVLEPGMCFSIEPGIYIPGDAGVRIEDCVHITANGCAPFTHTPKELQTIPLR